MTEYLIGTGGWAYFKIPNKPSLRAYSEVFNFVEVNYTFYDYPDARMVERWRRTVPKGFTFAVRCHQDLTHRIGLVPTDEAYAVLGKMMTYCRILDAPFLVMETPASFIFDDEKVSAARDFLSSAKLGNVQLVWEIRAPATPALVDLMQDLNIVQSTDLSKEEPRVKSDVVYTRLFGKGKHNIYQFDDEELQDIDSKIVKIRPKVAAMSFHGLRMNADAARFKNYKKTGNFLPVTAFTGVESAKAVLAEDAQFPASRSAIIENQGWKVIDLTAEKRVHLSELLTQLPDKTYKNLNEVVETLEAIR